MTSFVCGCVVSCVTLEESVCSRGARGATQGRRRVDNDAQRLSAPPFYSIVTRIHTRIHSSIHSITIMFGPLFLLKWKGTLCPCLEGSQDQAARKALARLEHLDVMWLRDKGDGGNMFEKIFSSQKKAGGIPSTLVLLDGERGPLLQIEPKPLENSPSTSGLQQSAGYIKTISLNEIQTADHKGDIVSLRTTVGGKPKKLLQFQVCNGNVEHVQDALQILVTWETNRLPEEEREMNTTDSLNRAQKAAHFCQRELELKRLKSEREKRKAKYIGMSGGGLKYTALAMANREDATVT